MVRDCGCGCEESRTTYSLEVDRERDSVRLWTRMRREQDNVLSGSGEGASWCQIVDMDAKRARQRTAWRGRGSVMVSNCGRRCEEGKTTYYLEVERVCDHVRLRMWIQRKQNDVLPEGGEEA